VLLCVGSGPVFCVVLVMACCVVCFWVIRWWSSCVVAVSVWLDSTESFQPM